MDYEGPEYRHGGRKGTQWALEDTRVRGVTNKYPHLILWGWGLLVAVVLGSGLILDSCG